MRPLILVLSLLLIVGFAVSSAAQQTKDQQNCTNALNNEARKVADKIGKEWCKCIQDKTKGKVADVEDCVDADAKSKIAKAILKIGDQDAKKCSGDDKDGNPRKPDFCVTATPEPTISAAAFAKEDAILHGVFGSDVDAALLADKNGNKCQLALAKTAKKCQATKLKEFNKCKKVALKDGAADGDALQDACLGIGAVAQPDEKGKIAKACIDKIDTDIDKKCVGKGVDLSDAAPGCGTDDPATLGACIDHLVECRVCTYLNVVDNLARDCDLFDDGIDNASCVSGTSPAELLDIPGLQTDMAFLADDALLGRENNTPESVIVQEWLIDQVESFTAGLDPNQSGRAAYKQPFTLGTNILAVIPGRELPDEYVMVGAHFDHHSVCSTNDIGDTICNGATDNASGVVETLAIGRAIAASGVAPRRSVILAFWDREEDGLLGSVFYANNPLVPLADTITYVNFDIQGANLLPSARNFSVAVGTETGGTVLRDLTLDAISDHTLGTQLLSFIFGQRRSDYASLVDVGVPSVFFSDSTGGCYHTAQDDIDVVDFGKLALQLRISMDVTLGLIETDTRPTFAPPVVLATFEDAVVINDVINDGIADLALFSPADQAILLAAQATLNAMVADGPGNFDAADIGTLLANTLQLVTLITRQECDGFLLP